MFSTTAASPCSVASHHQITLPGNEGKESRIFQVRPSTSGGVKSLKLTPAMYMTLDGSSVARNNNTNSPHTRASSSQASLHHLDLGGEGIYGDHPLAPGGPAAPLHSLERLPFGKTYAPWHVRKKAEAHGSIAFSSHTLYPMLQSPLFSELSGTAVSRRNRLKHRRHL